MTAELINKSGTPNLATVAEVDETKERKEKVVDILADGKAVETNQEPSKDKPDREDDSVHE
ncbi:unnamed protein product [Lepidochelys kempii]